MGIAQAQTVLPPGVTATHTAYREKGNGVGIGISRPWGAATSWEEGSVPNSASAIVWLPGNYDDTDNTKDLKASNTLIGANTEVLVKAIYHGGTGAGIDMLAGASIRFSNPGIDFVMRVPTTGDNLNNRFGVSLFDVAPTTDTLPRPPAPGSDYTPDGNRPKISVPKGALVKSVMQMMVRQGQKSTPFKMSYELTGALANESLMLVRYNSRYNSRPVFKVDANGKQVLSSYIALPSSEAEGWVPVTTMVSKVGSKTILDVTDFQTIEGDGLGPQYMYYLLVSAANLYETVLTDKDFMRTIKVDAVDGSNSTVGYLLGGGTFSFWKKEGWTWMEGTPSGNTADIKCTKVESGGRPQNINTFSEITLSVPTDLLNRSDFLEELKRGVQQSSAYKTGKLDMVSVVGTGFKLLPKGGTVSWTMEEVKNIIQMQFLSEQLAPHIPRRDLYVSRTRYVDIILKEAKAKDTDPDVYTNAMRSTLSFVNANLTVLPLYLQSWKGCVRQGKAELSWKLGVSQAAIFSEVERSADGVFYERVWAGQVSEYEEVIPLAGAFYRLRLEGKNGTVLYSRPIFLSLEEQLEELRVWPNPTQGPVSFMYTGKPYAEVILRLVDLQGRLVQQQSARLSAQGQLSQQFQAPAAGVYILQVQSAQGAVVQKVMVE